MLRKKNPSTSTITKASKEKISDQVHLKLKGRRFIESNRNTQLYCFSVFVCGAAGIIGVKQVTVV